MIDFFQNLSGLYMYKYTEKGGKSGEREKTNKRPGLSIIFTRMCGLTCCLFFLPAINQYMSE